MFLSETHQPVEAAAYAVSGVRRIPTAVFERFRKHAVCRGCNQPISERVQLVIRGDSVFHESCSKRWQSATVRSPAASTSSTPQIIATLAGIAVSFDRAGCGVIARDGSTAHERFTLDCFDDSLAAGGQQLRVDHQDVALAGRFVRLGVDAMLLKFSFELHDGLRERDVLRKIKKGVIRFCSVGFTPELNGYCWPGAILEHSRARLTEITLCDSYRPAWYGTSVRAVAP